MAAGRSPRSGVVGSVFRLHRRGTHVISRHDAPLLSPVSRVCARRRQSAIHRRGRREDDVPGYGSRDAPFGEQHCWRNDEPEWGQRGHPQPPRRDVSRYPMDGDGRPGPADAEDAPRSGAPIREPFDGARDAEDGQHRPVSEFVGDQSDAHTHEEHDCSHSVLEYGRITDVHSTGRSVPRMLQPTVSAMLGNPPHRASVPAGEDVRYST